MALARVLETEVMDTAAEARDYDAMEHRAVNDRFCVDFLAAAARAQRDVARVIDLGTGTAQIPIVLCGHTAAVHVTAVDLAEHMLAIAQTNITRAALAARITLVKMDAKHTPWPKASFDGVISNSIIHHIPSPGEALGEMTRLVAPGGVLFVRDLARPDADPDVTKLVATYGVIPPGLSADERAMHQRQRLLFEASLRAALTLDEVRALVAPLGICADSVTMTSDRHWTIAHVMPS